jgi:seryl-tRNA synthetase
MLPIALFRNAQEKERIIAGLKKKHFANLDIVDEIIALDEQKRQVQSQSESLTAVH